MRWKTVKRVWRIWRLRPYIDITCSGQRTDRPRVGVGVNSSHGMQGLFDYADDDQGNAAATMHARTVSHITGFPILDRRPGGERWRGPAAMEAGVQEIRDRVAASARLGY